MKTLAEFKNYWKHQTIFVVGTGPSNRVFPFDFIRDKPCIGLNQAWRICQCRYNITIHPHCIPFEQLESNIWFTKKKNDWSIEEHIRRNNHQNWIYFNNSDDINAINSNAPSLAATLYVGRGIQSGGLHLAAHMGARWAVLVGCDMVDLADDHHATDQHVQFHGIDKNDVYKEYYYYTAEVRKRLKQEYNMDTLTLSPFLGQKYADEDYAYLCKQNSLDPLPYPTEIETAKRNTPLVKDYLS